VHRGLELEVEGLRSPGQFDTRSATTVRGRTGEQRDRAVADRGALDERHRAHAFDAWDVSEGLEVDLPRFGASLREHHLQVGAGALDRDIGLQTRPSPSEASGQRSPSGGHRDEDHRDCVRVRPASDMADRQRPGQAAAPGCEARCRPRKAGDHHGGEDAGSEQRRGRRHHRDRVDPAGPRFVRDGETPVAAQLPEGDRGDEHDDQAGTGMHGGPAAGLLRAAGDRRLDRRPARSHPVHGQCRDPDAGRGGGAGGHR